MKTNELLANVRVASPCSARWADMTGDARARFCAQCQKHVYDLSAMTAEAAAGLIREKEGRLCVRFYQRADGTMLTADCPVGVERYWHRAGRWGVAAALFLFFGASAVVLAGNSDRASFRQARGRFTATLDEAVWTVKGWFGMQRPLRLVMGEICAPPPKRPPSPPTVSNAKE